MTQPLKITIITVCFNAGATLERCLQSVAMQDYPAVEHLVIDGGSADDSLSIAERYQGSIARLVSEPDRGLYDAMNKGIRLATGDVIGTLNADDYFIDSSVLTRIAGAFAQSGADVVYGDLNYVNAAGRIVRRWKSGKFVKGAFNRGWMPPHPAFYARKDLFSQRGEYRLDYGTAADSELMLRFMHNTDIRVFYLGLFFLNMQTGGISNKSFTHRVKASVNDLKSMRKNGITFPLLTLLLKPLRKVFQYLKL